MHGYDEQLPGGGGGGGGRVNLCMLCRACFFNVYVGFNNVPREIMSTGDFSIVNIYLF